MDQYIGEIRIFAGNFAPRGWFLCQGQRIEIAQFSSLFALLGTTYGGDGRTYFNLPDLRGRIPLHYGNSVGPGMSYNYLGQMKGDEDHYLSEQEMPNHKHSISAIKETGTKAEPQGHLLANTSGFDREYSTTENKNIVQMHPEMLNYTGGDSSFNIIQPSLVTNFIIAYEGEWPNRN